MIKVFEVEPSSHSLEDGEGKSRVMPFSPSKSMLEVSPNILANFLRRMTGPPLFSWMNDTRQTDQSNPRENPRESASTKTSSSFLTSCPCFLALHSIKIESKIKRWYQILLVRIGLTTGGRNHSINLTGNEARVAQVSREKANLSAFSSWKIQVLEPFVVDVKLLFPFYFSFSTTLYSREHTRHVAVNLLDCYGGLNWGHWVMTSALWWVKGSETKDLWAKCLEDAHMKMKS